MALKTCREQWTIGTGGVRKTGRSMLAALHDDASSEILFCICSVYIYIYIYRERGGDIDNKVIQVGEIYKEKIGR